MLYFLNNLFFLLVISVLFIALLNKLLREEKVLYRIFSCAFLAHVVLIIIFFLNIHSSFDPNVVFSKFYNDGETYSSNGHLISKTVKKVTVSREFYYNFPGIQYVLNYENANGKVSLDNLLIPKPNTYQVGYISYFYGAIYAAFGYYPVIINALNSMLHVLSGLLIFKIGKFIFNKSTGQLASLFFVFDPILFYNTSTKLKESLYLFSAIAILYLLIITANKRWHHVFFTIPFLIIIFCLTEHFIYPTLLVICIYFICKLVISCRYTLAALLPVAIYFTYTNYETICNKFIFLFNRCMGRSYSGFTDFGSGYNILLFGSEYEKYGFVKRIITLFNAWYHMIFEPMINNFMSYKFILFYPVNLFFVLLFIFSILGVVISFRKKVAENILLISFLVIFGSIVALASGNIGTMLRHRAIISPVICIYSAYFISLLIGKSHGKGFYRFS